jgi:hypothetical protein
MAMARARTTAPSSHHSHAGVPLDVDTGRVDAVDVGLVEGVGVGVGVGAGVGVGVWVGVAVGVGVRLRDPDAVGSATDGVGRDTLAVRDGNVGPLPLQAASSRPEAANAVSMPTLVRRRGAGRPGGRTLTGISSRVEERAARSRAPSKTRATAVPQANEPARPHTVAR